MLVSVRSALLKRFRDTGRKARRRNRIVRSEPLESRAMLTTYYVDSGAIAGGDGSLESPFLTIQAAIDAAAANPGDDTVAIQAGIYNENLLVSDTSGALTLTGISGDRGTVIIRNATDANTIEIHGSMDVQISNLTVQGGDAERGGQRGIWYRDAGGRTGPTSSLTVHNTVVQDHLAGGVVVERAGNVMVADSLLTNNHNGVFTFAVGQVTLEQVTAIFNHRDGAQINTAAGLTLSGGTYDDNWIHGLFAGNINGDVQLENASFNRNNDNGIDIRGVRDVSVSDIEVLDNGAFGGLDGLIITGGGAQNVTLQRVTASGNTGSGIGLRAVSQSVQASDIVAHDNGFSGLTVANTPISLALQTGHFSGNTRHGIFVGGLSSISIEGVLAENNGFVNNGADAGGGGIRIESSVAGATLHLADSTLTGNVSPLAGGGLSVTGTVNATIENVSISGNQATGIGGGGGISLRTHAANSVIRNSMISQNQAASGGGVSFVLPELLTAGSLLIEDTTISGNVASFGGGIYHQSQNLHIRRSTIDSNTATSSFNGGGGIALRGETLIENSTISGNHAQDDGGGIAIRNNPYNVNIYYTTITDNTAVNRGGGIDFFAGDVAVYIGTSIIAGNSAGDGTHDYSGGFHSLGSNLIGDGTGTQVGNPFSDLIGTAEQPIDALLAELADNGGSTWTHALLPGSPAIDAVDSRVNLVHDHDQRNIARPQGAARDIGAFELEYEPEPNEPPIVDDQSITIDQGTQYHGQLTATDPDGDPLTFQLVSGPEHHSAFGFFSSGSFQYTPQADFVGTDSFTFRAFDGKEYSEVGTISITVVEVNNPPTANDDYYTTLQDTPLVVSAEAGPALLDQTNERETGLHQFNTAFLTLQQQVVAGKTGYLSSVDVYIGQFSDPGRVLDFYVNVGAALQTDTPEFRTQYTLQASDINGWLTIDVSSANIYLEAGEAFTIGAFAHGSPNLFLLATNSDLVNGDNYTPGRLWMNGSPYVTPGGNDMDLLFRTRMSDTAAIGGVLENDTDPDGDPLSAQLLTQPENGTVSLDANGSFTYVPNAGFYGEDSFTYLADDGRGGTDTATVFITVERVNNPPVGSDHHFMIPEDSAEGTVVGQVNATDPDGDVLTYEIASGNEAGAFAISADGQITVADATVLDYDVTPVYQLTVSVSDGQFTATSYVTIELTPVDKVLPVVIEILPGDPTNTIDPTKSQTIEVVIYSSATFDATQIDVESLRFGATGTEDSLRRRGRNGEPQVRFEDLNGDGLLDMIVTFDSSLTGLTEGDTEAILTGELLDGGSFIGSDFVTVSSRKSGGGGGGGGGNGGGPKKK